MIRPLFGNHETLKGLSDSNFELMKDRKKGLDTAAKVYQKNLLYENMTGTDARYSDQFQKEPGVLKPELQGTELATIVSAAHGLNSLYLSKYNQHLSDLAEQNEATHDQYLSKVETRNKKQNAINAERKHINFMMLQATRRYEEMISKQIGRPFRFDDFDPKDYMKPIGAPE
jgi:hypothetical protein